MLVEQSGHSYSTCCLPHSSTQQLPILVIHCAMGFCVICTDERPNVGIGNPLSSREDYFSGACFAIGMAKLSLLRSQICCRSSVLIMTVCLSGRKLLLPGRCSGHRILSKPCFPRLWRFSCIADEVKTILMESSFFYYGDSCFAIEVDLS